MLLCLACYEDRLASLLDTAKELRLFQTNDGRTREQGRLPLPAGGCRALPGALTRAGVQVLLCGAVSGRLLQDLRAQGLEVRSWLRGSPDEVLAAWAAGELNRLRMPGCAPAPETVPGQGRGACHGNPRRRK